MKKLLKYGIGATVVGGITAAIAIPIALKVEEKEDVIRHIDMEQIAWGNTKLKDLVTEMKKEESVSGSILTSVSKASTFILYDEEQKGSIELQKKFFEYKLFELREEKGKSGTTDERKKAIDKEVTDIKAKLAKTLSNVDYESTSFSSDFPKVLMPREIIQQRQEKILKENRKAFVAQFSTKAEGEKAWLDERHNKYNGATNDAQAVAMLVYQIIKKDAYGKMNYKLNSEYTIKMQSATNEKGNIIFDFLKNAAKKTSNPLPTDKVYFISTNSKIPGEIYFETDSTKNTQIDDMGKMNLVHLYHALIPAIQNVKGSSLPWNITKADLIGDDSKGNAGLLSMHGSSNTSFIKSLEKLFDTSSASQVEADNFFISHSLSQPTAAKYGSLGVNTQIGSLKGFAPGFVLGSIEGFKAINAGSVTHTEGDAVITKIISGIESIFTSKSITNQEQLVSYINSLTDQEITNIFGGVFRDAFGDKPKLFYMLSDQSFMVMSKFGIHIIKAEGLANGAALTTQINKDLQSAADEQNTDKVVLNYTQLFSRLSSTEKIVAKLMNDAPFVAQLETGYNNVNKIGTEVEDQLKEDGTKKTWTEVKEDIKKAIDNIVASNKIQQVMGALGSNFDTFLEGKYDNNLLDKGVVGSTISPGDIYKDAIGLVG